MIMQRCIFVEGIGRVHALSDKSGRLDCAAMDAVMPAIQLRDGLAAFEILAPFIFDGQRDARIRWSVRFKETHS